MGPAMPEADLVIVGGGLSGLIAAGEGLSQGLKVALISKSPGGSLPLSWGGLDLLGRSLSGAVAESPFEEIEKMARALPDHPYAKAGIASLERGVELFSELLAAAALLEGGCAPPHGGRGGGGPATLQKGTLPWLCVKKEHLGRLYVAQ